MNKARRHIAIVDDEESVCKALQRLLRSAGIDAVMFLSGEEFLAWLGTHSTGCVILDLHMPRVTGFDVLTRMAQSDMHVPVIIITGQDSPEAYDRAMAAGATMYLRKPVNDEELLDAVRAAVSDERKGTV